MPEPRRWLGTRPGCAPSSGGRHVGRRKPPRNRQDRRSRSPRPCGPLGRRNQRLVKSERDTRVLIREIGGREPKAFCERRRINTSLGDMVDNRAHKARRHGGCLHLILALAVRAVALWDRHGRTIDSAADTRAGDRGGFRAWLHSVVRLGRRGPPAPHRLIGHPNQPQPALHRTGRQPQRHPEQHLRRQTGLNCGVAGTLWASAQRWNLTHLEIKPSRQRSASFHAVSACRPDRGLVLSVAPIAHTFQRSRRGPTGKPRP